MRPSSAMIIIANREREREKKERKEFLFTNLTEIVLLLALTEYRFYLRSMNQRITCSRFVFQRSNTTRCPRGFFSLFELNAAKVLKTIDLSLQFVGTFRSLGEPMRFEEIRGWVRLFDNATPIDLIFEPM